MPIKDYYGGRGLEVMRQMVKKYGKKRGKEIFYATLNKMEAKKKKGKKK